MLKTLGWMNKCWAEKQGIEPGSELVKINGEEAKMMSGKEFMETIKDRPLRLLIKPRKMTERNEAYSRTRKGASGVCVPAPPMLENGMLALLEGFWRWMKTDAEDAASNARHGDIHAPRTGSVWL